MDHWGINNPHHRRGDDLPSAKMQRDAQQATPIVVVIAVILGLSAVVSAALGIAVLATGGGFGLANLLFGVAILSAALVVVPKVVVDRKIARLNGTTRK